MVELRTVATAVSAYATDFAYVPKVPTGVVEDLTPYLVPTYLRTLPYQDGWRRAMLYNSEGLNYTVRSNGSDGTMQAGPPMGPTTSYGDDMVMVNGVFVQWPPVMCPLQKGLASGRQLWYATARRSPEGVLCFARINDTSN
jgi:hypothetical protein